MALPTKLSLDIVTPYGQLLSTEVDQVTATGAAGEFSILPGHLPLLSALKPGPFSFRRKGEFLQFQAGSGFAEAGGDHVIILVGTFERGEILSLKALIEWEPPPLSVQDDARRIALTEAYKNAIARAETRMRELENKDEEKGEEYQQLQKLTAIARTRLEDKR